jgi:hypothetical protein
MPHALEATRQVGSGVPKRMPFAAFMAAIAATTIALIFGLGAMLSRPECLVVVLGAAALAGGAVFTVSEMQRLGKRSR